MAQQSFTAQNAVVPLEAGQTYALRIEYFNTSSTAQMQFGWVPVSSMTLSDEDHLAISSADVVIACMGLGGFESEGRDRPYDLPAPQGWYLKLVGQANPHTIVVITAGAGVGMNEWLDEVAGLIYVWYPGENGNTALADILFGKTDPSGRLPDTFSKQWSDEAAFMNYPAPIIAFILMKASTLATAGLIKRKSIRSSVSALDFPTPIFLLVRFGSTAAGMGKIASFRFPLTLPTPANVRGPRWLKFTFVRRRIRP